MPFDGAFLCSVINELRNTVLGARIEKVLQPEFDEIVLQLHTKIGSAKLLLSSAPDAARIHITETVKKNPDVPPTFCMLLRKHITGGRIVDILQPDFDRIADVVIETKNDLQDITEKHLIIEMMGKYSNIILTDDKNRIFDCAKRVDEQMSTVRELFPGIIYEKPPQAGKKNPLDFVDTDIIQHTDIDGDKFYSESFCGISQPTGRELLKMEKEINKNPIAYFLNKIETLMPVTYINMKGKPDMLPFAYESIDAEYKKWESPSELLDSFFEIRDKQNRLRQYTANVMKTLRNNLSRAEKKKGLLEKELLAVKDNDMNKLYGELLTANIYMLSKGMDKVTVQNYYTEDCSDIDVPMRVDLTPSENIQCYYKRYTKGKNAQSEITKQLDDTQNEIEYLQGQIYNTEFCTTSEEIDEIIYELTKLGYMKPSAKQKKRKEEQKSSTLPSHFTTRAGRDVYVGRNNKQNEYLTHKMANGNDIWFHAKDIPASHVILKCNGEMPEECIIDAATLAAYNSSCRGATRIPVDYCFKKNVHKVNGAKPGYVIYDNYYTVIVDGTEEAVNKILSK